MRCTRCQAELLVGARFCASCGAATLELGPDSVVGSYRILDVIGSGGMGTVFRAEHTRLKRLVCIKALLRTHASDADMLKRFEREATLLASVRHPNVVSVLDIGQLPDGGLYLVLEFVEGQDLRAAMKDGPLEPARAVRMLLQVLAGLAEVHQLGIIHRDLKPANVLIRALRDGTEVVQLADFGIARRIVDPAITESNVTGTGLIMGTPGYLAPEQIMGEVTDVRADLYACGVLFYEMLTGTKLFSGESGAELLRKHLLTPPPPLEAPHSHFNSFLERALAKEAAHRFQTASDMNAALVALTQAPRLSSPRPPAGGPRAAGEPAAPPTRPESPPALRPVPTLSPATSAAVQPLPRTPSRPEVAVPLADSSAPAPSASASASPAQRVGFAHASATAARAIDDWAKADGARRTQLVREFETVLSGWLGQRTAGPVLETMRLVLSRKDASLETAVRAIVVERIGAAVQTFSSQPPGDLRALLEFAGPEAHDRLLSSLKHVESAPLATVLAAAVLQGPLRQVSDRLPGFGSPGVTAVVASCAQRSFNEVRPLLVLAINHAEAGARAGAVSQLSPEQALQLAPELRKRLADKAAPVRLATVKQLGAIEDRQAAPALVTMLKRVDAPPDERLAVIDALGEIRGAEASSALRDALGSEKQPDVRCALADALGRVGDVASLELLKREASRLLAPAPFKAVCAKYLTRKT